MSRHVLVYGAYGHTGKFVVAELLRRGLVPVLSGRDPVALAELGRRHPDLEVKPAAIDDRSSLDEVMTDVAGVVNCAGPFLDTSLAVAGAAVRAGVHYLDLAAEQAAVQSIYRAQTELGWRTDVAVVPAMAFYGGLPDLLATTAVAEWNEVDDIATFVGLDRWWPTVGTRMTGQRNTVPRLVVEGGELVAAPDPAPVRRWDFPAPFGLSQEVVQVPLSEIVTIARHLDCSKIGTYLASVALDDIHDPATPVPQAVDDSGRSAQRFAVDVVARRGAEKRRISVCGRDIYAVSAPLVVEAVERILDGRAKVQGVAAPGETFDAPDFLRALSPDSLTLQHDFP